MLYIPLLYGTGREVRKSEPAARYMLRKMQDAGIETEIFMAGDISTGVTFGPKQPVQKKTRPWKDAMTRADGLVIVTPEYNHGYPGELKIALDALYQEYHRKPVAICGASDGGLGGVRCVEQLRQVAIELRMMPLRHAVYFSFVDKMFGEDGQPTDPEFGKRVDPMIQDLIWHAEALKVAREKT